MTSVEIDSEISEDESEDLGTVDLNALEESLNETAEVPITETSPDTDPGRTRTEEIRQVRAVEQTELVTVSLLQISAMMRCLPPDCLRDVVTDYLQAQTPARARQLVESWGKHWSRLAVSRPARPARARTRGARLREVFISTSEFSEEDKVSMLSCFYRSAA